MKKKLLKKKEKKEMTEKKAYFLQIRADKKEMLIPLPISTKPLSLLLSSVFESFTENWELQSFFNKVLQIYKKQIVANNL